MQLQLQAPCSLRAFLYLHLHTALHLHSHFAQRRVFALRVGAVCCLLFVAVMLDFDATIRNV
jgi:hypothetical protein